MGTQIDAIEAQRQWPALLERLESGEQFTITKYGHAIAHLVPVRRVNTERRREAVERLKEFAKGRTLGVPVRQLIEEGRR